MSRTNSYVPNLDAAENTLGQYPAAQQTVILLRAGFADLARLLHAIHGELQTANRIAIRAQRGTAVDTGTDVE